MAKEEDFTRTIKENQAMLYRISMFYTTQEDDRKDLFQEIVIQLWKSYDNFRQESKITTWMYRIALNTAITQFRKAKRKITETSINEAVLNYSDRNDTDIEEQITTLHREIQKLNDLDKGIIFLLLENKTYEEISALTGLTITNVATRLFRIKQRLKSQIKSK